MPPPLQPIPADAFDTSLPPPQYSADFASIVGNAASDTDGFESIFSDLASHLADAPNFLTGFDLDLGDLGAAGDPAGIPFEQEFSDSLTSTISQGQGDFDAFAVHLTGNNPPTSSGGGGGTGGGTATAHPCEVEISFAANTALPFSQSTNFFHHSAGVLHIQSKVLSDPTPGTFTVSENIPAAMPSGTSATITITQHKTAPSGYRATFTVTSDDPDSPHLLCIVVSVSNSVTQPGGSGGGSGHGGPVGRQL